MGFSAGQLCYTYIMHPILLALCAKYASKFIIQVEKRIVFYTSIAGTLGCKLNVHAAHLLVINKVLNEVEHKGRE